MKVVGAKGNGKSRSFKLKADVQIAVRDYVRECVLACRSEELNRNFFLGNKMGVGWSYEGVRRVCKNVSKKLGTHVSIYMFRRLVATEMFARKVALQDIQHHMGHLRSSTTLRYVQADHEMNHEGVVAMAELLNETVVIEPDVSLSRC